MIRKEGREKDCFFFFLEVGNMCVSSRVCREILDEASLYVCCSISRPLHIRKQPPPPSTHPVSVLRGHVDRKTTHHDFCGTYLSSKSKSYSAVHSFMSSNDLQTTSSSTYCLGDEIQYILKQPVSVQFPATFCSSPSVLLSKLIIIYALLIFHFMFVRLC